MVIKPKCPNCLAEYKDIKKCRKCLKYCCSECSMDILCLDCYALVYAPLEIYTYHEDKRIKNAV